MTATVEYCVKFGTSSILPACQTESKVSKRIKIWILSSQRGCQQKAVNELLQSLV